MKRAVLQLFGLAILAILICVQAVTLPTDTTTSFEPTTITNYAADFTLAKDGDLTAVETLTMNFPGSSQHGIFRFFDRRDPTDSRARTTPHNISVLRDGQREDFEVLKEKGGRYRNVKIGSADRFLNAGEHTYVIRYTINGVLGKGTNGLRTQFYWNLIPGGWQQRIDKSELTVHFPAPIQPGTQCAVGPNETLGCALDQVDQNTLKVNTGALAARTPVTLKAGVDIATPDRGEKKLWSIAWDDVLGPNVLMLLIVLGLGLLAGLAGLVQAQRTREPKPPFPLQYAPPEGIGPAQALYIYKEDVDQSTFVASILQQAEKGASTLTPIGAKGKEWTITDRGSAEAWQELDPITAYVGQLLDVPGGSFTASKKSVAGGKKLQSAIAQFESGTKAWATQNGLMVSSGLGSFGGLLVLLGVAGAAALALFNPFGMSMLALIPGLWAIGAAGLAEKGSGTMRTSAGRDLWSRIGGFHRVLSTPSSNERFDFSGRKELYTAYIPWAVAFGCANAWASKYRTEVGEEPPTPGYFAGGYIAGSNSGDYVNSMVDSFSSTVDSAISSYQATQSSSSSGGGGFSGGGGGGGGGGGSW